MSLNILEAPRPPPAVALDRTSAIAVPSSSSSSSSSVPQQSQDLEQRKKLRKRILQRLSLSFLLLRRRKEGREGRESRGGEGGVGRRYSLNPSFLRSSFTSKTSTSSSSNDPSSRHMIRNNKSKTKFSSPLVLEFVQHGGSCPREVLPLILAFAGPQTALNLSRTSRFWNGLLQEEGTWKVQCQELYKWQPGDPEPSSWRQLYETSPCVPIDYSSVERALAAVTTSLSSSTPPSPSSSPLVKKIWLRPNHQCVMHQPLVISQDLVIETMHVTVRNNCAFSTQQNRQDRGPQTAKATTATKAKHTATTKWTRGHSKRRSVCNTNDNSSSNQDNEALEDTYRSDSDEEDSPVQQQTRTAAASSTMTTETVPAPSPATLLLHTRQHNTPIIWVHSGCLEVKGVIMNHACLGVDIWNGNAALQIQPLSPSPHHPRLAQALLTGDDRHPQSLSSSSSSSLQSPRVVLTKCQVTSQSGRGIVVMDGGQVEAHDSGILDCAATGVYIGGGGGNGITANNNNSSSLARRSRAVLHQTRVMGNGVGSYYQLDHNHHHHHNLHHHSIPLLRPHRFPRRSSVIARGHSGVYLEQGECHVLSSIVSANALTGISAVSDQITLVVQESQLVANGSLQLETLPSQNVRLENNRIEAAVAANPAPALPHGVVGAGDGDGDFEELDEQMLQLHQP